MIKDGKDFYVDCLIEIEKSISDYNLSIENANCILHDYQDKISQIDKTISENAAYISDMKKRLYRVWYLLITSVLIIYLNFFYIDSFFLEIIIMNLSIILDTFFTKYFD